MVDYRIQEHVAVLEVNNPPVNALSVSVRKGLDDCIRKAIRNETVKALVITGKGQTFIAGADIREFDKSAQGPWITDIGDIVEASHKPVVAAINGMALGGGLEVALFCHYRVALSSAKVGFPEVHLGLLPGAGGTQRLPRVTDVYFAMEMISTGRQIPASIAMEKGILDKIVEENLLTECIRFALNVCGKPLGPRRLSQLPVIGKATLLQKYEAAVQQVKLKQPGFLAPLVCLKAVHCAAELEYTEGMLQEMMLFLELQSGPQSKALRYTFFADRAAQKWQLPCGASASSTKSLSVKTTGVIGAGMMGTGITVCLLRLGFPVTLVEQNQKFLVKGIETIHQLFHDAVHCGVLTENDVKRFLTNLKPSVDMQSVASVDLVIEAVYENTDLKKDIFRTLDTICKHSTILCTTTSTTDIDIIASATKRPSKVVGMHFFPPAHTMCLLENVYGTLTLPETVATVMELGKKMNKISVLVKTCPGFVANRINAYWNIEASLMVEEGALPQEIDKVLEDFGMPLGPFKIADLSGIDVRWLMQQDEAKSLGIQLTPETRYFKGEHYSSLLYKIYEAGRFGCKTGKGWYSYDKPGGRITMNNDKVTGIIEKHCADLGIERHSISTQEILERCLYSCINEGFRCLEDGVASKPEDIDVIYLYGFSFPRYMGGPMFYASQTGLKKVYDRICYYHRNFPLSSHWVPSDLLRKLASVENPVPISKWMETYRSKL